MNEIFKMLNDSLQTLQNVEELIEESIEFDENEFPTESWIKTKSQYLSTVDRIVISEIRCLLEMEKKELYRIPDSLNLNCENDKKVIEYINNFIKHIEPSNRSILFIYKHLVLEQNVFMMYINENRSSEIAELYKKEIKNIYIASKFCVHSQNQIMCIFSEIVGDYLKYKILDLESNNLAPIDNYYSTGFIKNRILC